MGEVVRLADVRTRKPRTDAAERAWPGEPSPQRRGFASVESGSGWYHGEAIRAALKPGAEPH